MKITSVETFTRDPISIVCLRTDDGYEGFGQVAPFNADITATILHRQIAPHALGADATDIDALVDLCVEREYKFPGSYVRRAVGGGSHARCRDQVPHSRRNLAGSGRGAENLR